MKDKLIIHIGLGKAASSTMQLKIFNLIAENLGYFYISNKSEVKNNIDLDLKNQMTKHITKMILGINVDKIDFPNFSLVSNEGFSSYREPQYYEEFAQKNLEAFGEDAHIILIIRKPSSFLNSIYVQCCVHEKPIMSPEFFFINEKNYSDRYPNNCYNISKADTFKLIEYYKSRFKKVSVLKYETLKDGNNLQKIFGFDDIIKNKISNIFESSRVNKSLGKNGLRFLTLINSALKIFGFSFTPKYSNKILLSRLNDSNKTETLKQKKLFYKMIIKINTILSNPKFIDKIFGYKKIKINFESLNIDIKKLDEEYSRIPDYQIFEK